MIYELEFRDEALKEWFKLGAVIKEEFKTVLRRRLENPRIPKHALCGMPDHYKIKLRSAGYRLVYRVEDVCVTVVVIAVGKRERGEVYEAARKRVERSRRAKTHTDAEGEERCRKRGFQNATAALSS